MHVVMVIPKVFRCGGTERQCIQLSEQLAESGVTVTTVTSRLFGEKTPRFHNGVRYVSILQMRGKIGYVIWTICAFMYRAIFLRKTDIVHVHFASWWACVGWVCRALFGKPYIVKIAGGGENGEMSVLKAGRVLHRFIQKAVYSADRIIAISGQIQEEVVSKGFPSERICRIPNGVDVRRFSMTNHDEKTDARRDLGIGTDFFILTYAGRLIEYKGVSVLLKAFQAVRAILPDAFLSIVGSGPEEAEMRSFVESSGLSDYVRFCGEVEDTVPYYRISDAVVLPSYSEGCPNTVLEAMSLGIPIIASAIEGTRDILAHMETAYLFSPGNAEELRKAVCALYDDRGLGQKMAVAARERVEKVYDIDRIAAEYRDVYSEVGQYGK